mmetsp:Transcript_15736/g.23182  ORF Transcript_15736/g.23182 Transcript_15736/m.23182 type:complete len:111 (-) Transcript_15736:36-368(-)
MVLSHEMDRILSEGRQTMKAPGHHQSSANACSRRDGLAPSLLSDEAEIKKFLSKDEEHRFDSNSIADGGCATGMGRTDVSSCYIREDLAEPPLIETLDCFPFLRCFHAFV